MVVKISLRFKTFVISQVKSAPAIQERPVTVAKMPELGCCTSRNSL